MGTSSRDRWVARGSVAWLNSSCAACVVEPGRLTFANVKRRTILLRRERIKRNTIEPRACSIAKPPPKMPTEMGQNLTKSARRRLKNSDDGQFATIEGRVYNVAGWPKPTTHRQRRGSCRHLTRMPESQRRSDNSGRLRSTLALPLCVSHWRC